MDEQNKLDQNLDKVPTENKGQPGAVVAPNPSEVAKNQPSTEDVSADSSPAMQNPDNTSYSWTNPVTALDSDSPKSKIVVAIVIGIIVMIGLTFLLAFI